MVLRAGGAFLPRGGQNLGVGFGEIGVGRALVEGSTKVNKSGVWSEHAGDWSSSHGGGELCKVVTAGGADHLGLWPGFQGNRSRRGDWAPLEGGPEAFPKSLQAVLGR